MKYILGIDTGGTYTDGVIISSKNNNILAKSKAFTTHDNLAEGIFNCINELDFENMSLIDEVHLSTTVAVNAVLESNFEKIGLLQIDRNVEGKVPAGYRYMMRLPFSYDKCLIDRNMQEFKDIRKVFMNNVNHIIVTTPTSKYSTDTELRIAHIIEKELGIKCTSASHICNDDNYYERTVTAILNVFLIPIVEEWISGIKKVMNKFGIRGEITMVNACGNLISCEEAINNPLKTVFSGLAASVRGGIALTQEKDFLLIDMGGTSSDITRIINNEQRRLNQYAKIDEFSIKEETINVKSYGIGGDSYIKARQDGEFVIGPEKAIPLCIASKKYPQLIEEIATYEAATNYEMLTAQSVDCYIGIKGAHINGLNPAEALTARYLIDNPHNIFYIAEHFGKDPDALHMDRLIKQKAVRLISLTPTDILHAEGSFVKWDNTISSIAVKKMSKEMKINSKEFIKKVKMQITNSLSKVCMQGIAAFEDVEFDFNECPGAAFLLERYFNDDNTLIRTEFNINNPIVAIGAPAGAWMQQVADKMGTKVIIPEHGEVANAFGAAIAEKIQV